MNKNLDHYILRLKNFIPDEVCEQAIKDLTDESLWKQHEFYNPITNTSAPHSGSKELDVTGFGTSVNGAIMEKVWHGLDTYMNHFKFSWFSSWQGYNTIRYNRYAETRVMAEHCDHIHSLFDGNRKGVPILTILGGLNDDYEGGEFVMFTDTPVEIGKGDLLIFPSNFLYPHRVDPVTKGVRYSYVSWAW
jgi:hypothetical protein